jgi:hypothetical protein
MSYAMSYPELRKIVSTAEKEIVTERRKTFLLRNKDRLLWSDEKVIRGKKESSRLCLFGLSIYWGAGIYGKTCDICDISSAFRTSGMFSIRMSSIK